MRRGKTQHVVPHPDGWAVRGDGNKRITSLHGTLDEAVSTARTLIAGRHAHIYVHGQHGPELLEAGT